MTGVAAGLHATTYKRACPTTTSPASSPASFSHLPACRLPVTTCSPAIPRHACRHLCCHHLPATLPTHHLILLPPLRNCNFLIRHHRPFDTARCLISGCLALLMPFAHTGLPILYLLSSVSPSPSHYLSPALPPSPSYYAMYLLPQFMALYAFLRV